MNQQPLAIIGGDVLTPWEGFSPGLVTVEQGKIAYAGLLDQARIPAGAAQLDASGKLVAPGLIDVHIHGSAGADFVRDGAAGLAKMARFLATHGVTAFLPTTPSAPIEQLQQRIEVARQAAAAAAGAQVLGIHLEGPYLSPQQRGAHHPEYLRKPDAEECARLVEAGRGAVKMITLAPELEGARDLIRWLRQHNVTVSLGHSVATYQEAKDALDAGADHACHLFNCMPDLNKREPGVAGALLYDDRAFIELIVDSAHIHPVMLKMAVRMKGARRTLLISDAMEAAGMPDGSYELGGLKVIVKESTARLEDGRLAGSTLSLDRAVRNAIEILEVSTEEAIAMASQSPADSLGLTGKGRLTAGADGDLVIFNQDLSVAATIIAGEVIYEERG